MIRIHSWRLGCAKPRRSGSGALLGNHRSFTIDLTGMKFGEIHRCALVVGTSRADVKNAFRLGETHGVTKTHIAQKVENEMRKLVKTSKGMGYTIHCHEKIIFEGSC